MGEELDDAWKILRMCRAAGPPVLELLQRHAEVLEDLAVDEFDLTVGRKGRDQPWNAVDDQARLALAFAQCVLRPPAFRNLLLQLFVGSGELVCSLLDFLERLVALGDVRHRANELEVARVVDCGMTDDVKVFDRSISHQQPMLEIELLSLA